MDSLIEEPPTGPGAALLNEQFRILRQQIPLMYLFMIVNAWFLSFGVSFAAYALLMAGRCGVSTGR